MRISRLNLVFLLHLAIFVFVVMGILPRMIVLYWTVALLIYILTVPPEESALFFVRSIPLFIAIPLTATFDNFNMWRIISLAIFVRWALPKISNYQSRKGAPRSPTGLFGFLISKQVPILKNKILKSRVFIILLFLLIFAILSVFAAADKTLAIKRVIYFANLSLIGFVINGLLARQADFRQKVIKNIAIPIILVTVIGFIQLLTTYLMDIFQFVDYWTFTVEKNLFGTGWANIALKANTWFAYFGDQLSLRMFSIFPDSHSFPIFILLGLPAVFALAVSRVIAKGGTVKTMMRERGSWLVVFVPPIFLAAILTGTRGIWAASVGVVILAIGLIWHMKRKYSDLRCPNILKYVSLYLILFFMLFAPAYALIASPQFLVSKSDSALFKKRVRSIIDIAETSNKERIRIWKLSLVSIKKHPLLGVGIGNFPVVLNQDLSLTRAGSSAHNLYLQIAAEMGLVALAVTLYFLWLVFKRAYQKFISSDNPFFATYYSAALLFLPWVLIYSLTDVALFDERAFLMFVSITALIL
ncbi:MAG: hypothetical protein A2750_03650 [Candidatus Yanofskybacteria bacterium RIFCSPHIGHO2_01_FULL_45_42]|uniref:O-antigen ligase-related domain-containing protein n=3 Tax=Candidatus Yanofskyibacteriota TaxID=1752733 RepID=A0A1F8EZ51_9BACT|nr:MAG: hypothetical protein A2750_03650 [Candidatus Yanofskybacteria bacterium RIFCSPHIGHO2_01_FULL_45_42]OGN16879.1 MAG: hypothetical protein A3C81_03200 [Candidatus Yanofskybacteria bacterium RIFCSPHIGHO2_02_FULL_46_19]OGN32031.1 MAG: hypothetical protein A3J01_03060 [Candidatus Yanofskybacteria bacterium RIFCSPLOWO2_02_FULL_45_18]